MELELWVRSRAHITTWKCNCSDWNVIISERLNSRLMIHSFQRIFEFFSFWYIFFVLNGSSRYFTIGSMNYGLQFLKSFVKNCKTWIVIKLIKRAQKLMREWKKGNRKITSKWEERNEKHLNNLGSKQQLINQSWNKFQSCRCNLLPS